jgi:RNA polymerase sigma-70 factor, ECF subfamily
VADLSSRLREAVQAFPGIRLEGRDFAGYLDEKLATSGASPAALETLHVADLYLAWACARGDSAALAIFDREHLVRVRALARGTDPAELEQLVRVRLLIPEAGARARIEQYSGRGPLAAWVRMVAARLAIDLARSAHPASADSEMLPGEALIDPELDYMKARYTKALNAALERALSALPSKQRALLKLCYVDAATPAAIARMYAVSPRTAQRWLLEARDQVLESTREQLASELAVRPVELDSLLELMKSRMHVTLQRVLAE